MSQLETLYLSSPYILASRARCQTEPKLWRLLAGRRDPIALLGFLVQFCALGVRMVERVDVWMHEAGEACVRAGRPALGRDIAARATEEAGHDQMLIEDLGVLACLWQDWFGRRLDTDALLSQPTPPATRRYAELHAEVAAGSTPWAQLGIEYEIETMSMVIGPPLIRCCHEALGDVGMRGLSFVRAHVELDACHTDEGAARLEALLRDDPESASAVARAGAEALEHYLDLLVTCIDRGLELGSSHGLMVVA